MFKKIATAIEKNDVYQIEKIIKEEPNSNLVWKGIWGSKSPLSRAVISNAEEFEAIVKLLLEYGADKTYIDESGKSAYDYAMENGNLVCQELLK